jgi:hypothetical protein
MRGLQAGDEDLPGAPDQSLRIDVPVDMRIEALVEDQPRDSMRHAPRRD